MIRFMALLLGFLATGCAEAPLLGEGAHDGLALRDALVSAQGTLAAGSNYAISFTPGLFTINPATLAVIASSAQVS